MFIGWDAKGRWRTLVVPGTKVYLKNGSILQRDGGLGLANAANVAKKLGMANAYELDGGGSTSLWTRSGHDMDAQGPLQDVCAERLRV